MQKTQARATKKPAASKPAAGLAALVKAFKQNRHITYGGKGFGSTALKIKGKIFAMLSSKGQFVVKLPKERVTELVESGTGEYFDPGRGRLMKEWLVVESDKSQWLKLAREACEFVRRGTR